MNNRDFADDRVWLTTSNEEGYVKRYAPLDKPELYKVFGDLQPTRGAILKFANKYGMLGHGETLAFRDTRPSPILYGESLRYWQRNILDMKRLTNFWKLLDSPGGPEKGELGRIVKWCSGPHISVSIEFRKPSLYLKLLATSIPRDDGKPTEGQALINYWETSNKVGDVVEPARFFLFNEINAQLRGHVSPTLITDSKRDIYMYPDCLLSALYVLFALDVAKGNRKNVICRACGEVIPDAKTVRRGFCNQACKQRVYDRNKRKAKNEALAVS